MTGSTMYSPTTQPPSSLSRRGSHPTRRKKTMITDFQRELRRKNLGGSDLAAVVEYAHSLPLGSLSPYKSAGDVFWEKRPDLVIAPALLPKPKATAAQSRGNRIEGYIVDCAREHLAPHTLTASQRRVSRGRDKGIIAVNLDAIVNETGTPVEAKSCADFKIRDEWGERETNRVPRGYAIQVQAAIHVTGAPNGYLFAVLGWDWSMEPVPYLIPRDETAIESIVDSALWFWHEHILAGVPPKGGEIPPEHLLKAVPVNEGQRVVLDDHALRLAEAFELHQELKNLHEKGQDAARLELWSLMGNAAIADLPNGRTFEKKVVASKTTDLDALKEQFPEAYKATRVESTQTRTYYKKG